MKIVTARLQLREFIISDLDALTTCMTPSEMRQFEKGLPDRDSVQVFLEQIIQKATEKPRNLYCLAITVPPADHVVGYISLKYQNPEIREWEIGWAIRMEDWRKGYASEAAGGMLDFAFQVLDAHRVVAFCHADNMASARVMKKIGMKQEGHLRQTRWFNECWADELVFATLKSENGKQDHHNQWQFINA